MLKDKKVVFFDCGNTLWSDIGAKKLMINSSLEYLNISSYDEFESFCSKNKVKSTLSPFYDAIYKLKKEDVSIEVIRSNIDKIFAKLSFEDYIELHPLNTSAKEVIEKISKKAQLGIIANQHSIAKKLLNYYGIDKYFKKIIMSCDYNIKKPSSDLFLIACKEFGISPEQAVMVGDSYYNDIVPAKKIGMKTVLISTENFVGKEIDFKYANLLEFLWGLLD